MLEKATRRLAACDIRNVTLLLVDAARLPFPDESFDAVYAPYLMSVVADPISVAREMRRVCRVGGRIVLLNHFLSRNHILSWIERRTAPLLVRCGFRPDLDMATFLTKAQLDPLTIETVNWPPLWSLLTCERARP
jgi:phosphatidylethanolamine/phosphatidyl-N-methylethanolamine N-methyltransferase